MMRTSTQVFKTLSTRGSMIPRATIAATQSSSFSTILDKKEQAEETKYIRSMEQRRQEEIRKNLERILALEDSAKEKQELHALLQEKKEEEKGFIAKWGLTDWQYAVPISMLVLTPLVFSEVRQEAIKSFFPFFNPLPPPSTFPISLPPLSLFSTSRSLLDDYH